MQKELKFSRSDGDSSLWPVCGQLKGGKRWERLENSNDHFIQYLDKLSVQLTDHFGRPRNSFPSLLLLPACSPTCCTDEVHSLPSGYALFVQHTANGTRKDRYLIGT